MDASAVAAAQRLGETLLRPAAERVDVQGVPRSHLDALAEAGLMDVVTLSPSVQRQVAEELAAADSSTWFVWTQHHTPVRTVLRGTNDGLREQVLPGLLAGTTLAGVAYTHLRRPGTPAVAAQRSPDGGWVVDGSIAWLTSWQLADVVLLGAQSGDEVVWVLVPLRDRPEVVAEPLALAAMAGTSTYTVSLRGLTVTPEQVVLVEPLADWREQDAARTVDVSAGVLGVTTEAVRRLRALDTDDGRRLAAALHERLGDLRVAAYELADEASPARVAQRLAVRAEAHVLACTATAALVATGGGRSMLLDQAAQRLARVALFLLVQGQTGAVRAAQLSAFGAGTGG